MENKSKKIYPATQLIVALDAKVLKTYLWILGWYSQGSIKYYPKQFAKACKMEEDEVDRCLQALEDAKLIDISKVDQTWMITPNAEQNQKYYKVELSKVLEGKGITMADKVTWKNECNKSNTDDLSEQELQSMILRLQAQLNEKRQVKQLVVNYQDDDVTDLPF